MSDFKIELERIQRQVDQWNAEQTVGAAVTVAGYEGPQSTRTEAMILFDQKPVIYLEGFNGYFDLPDVTPIAESSRATPAAEPLPLAFMFPGQGSQEPGMGEDLFDSYPELVEQADAILGYSIKTLCLEDPEELLGQTQYTQPALYTVNALSFLDQQQFDKVPACFLGHSLGEYNALLAAGVFDFETGLRLVRERGALMAEAEGGGMTAIIGMDAEQVAAVLEKEGLDTIDVANINTPQQTVISGLAEEVADVQEIFQAAGARLCIPLKVSGAFHSRYMQDAKTRFAELLANTHFNAPTTPVISNVTARPYEAGDVARLLAEQLISPVRWSEAIRYAVAQGVTEFKEVGPGHVLQRMGSAILSGD